MDIRLFKYTGDNNCYYSNDKLTVSVNSQGYARVIINKKTYRLHRLIAMKYIPNPCGYKYVDHIDNDKSNNCVDNLQWVTAKINSKKSWEQNPKQSKMHRGAVKVKASKNGIIKTFESVRDCARFLDRNPTSVSRCCKGEWNKCAGWSLEYIS